MTKAKAKADLPAPATGKAQARAGGYGGGATAERAKEQRRQKRLVILKALANRPLPVKAIIARTGLEKTTASGILCESPGSGWWKKSGGKFGAYEITAAGREALAEAGYVITPEMPPAGLDPADKAGVARAQCRLIAREIDRACQPLAAVQIATAAGLAYDAVAKFLRNQGPAQAADVPALFAKADRPGDYYTLTAAGRALAKEGEAQG